MGTSVVVTAAAVVVVVWHYVEDLWIVCHDGVVTVLTALTQCEIVVLLPLTYKSMKVSLATSLLCA